MKSHPAPVEHPKKHDVTYKDAVLFGLFSAAAVFLCTLVFTQGWSSLKSLGLTALYTVIAFVVVTGIAAFLHWVTGHEKGSENQEFPVLK